MKKRVIIEIEDVAYEPFMGMVKLCPQAEIVGVCEEVDVMAEREVCMKQVIETLRANKVFRHYYDYTWIMMALNEGLVDDFDAFRSPQAFLDYLYEIGIRELPSRITLSVAYAKTLDSYPDWTFIDVKKASETLRRKNVVKQFLSAYIKAKIANVNRIVNK